MGRWWGDDCGKSSVFNNLQIAAPPPDDDIVYGLLDADDIVFMSILSAAVAVALLQCLPTKQRNALVKGGGLQLGRDLTLFSGLLASSEEGMVPASTEEEAKGERPWGPLQNVHADRRRVKESLKRSGNMTAAARTAVPPPALPPKKRPRLFHPRKPPSK